MEREQLYTKALETLKSEHDLLEAQYVRLRERYVAAKSAIISISKLLDIEVDEKYQWNKPSNGRHQKRK